MNQARHPEPKILTVREAAELLRVTERCIAQWKADGRLPAMKLGGYIRFKREDVLALLQPVERIMAREQVRSFARQI
jgi:excisionase family DNA binding protein